MSRITKLMVLVFCILVTEYISAHSSILNADVDKTTISPKKFEHVKVVDGDSLEIGKNRIRLLGIDSPEYKQDCFNAQHKSYSCGIKAARYMQKLVSDGDLRCEVKSRDRYERSLCVCYAGDVEINAEMVRAGWAVAYRDDEGRYQKLEQSAQKQKKGIWQGKFMRPEFYRITHRRKQ